MTAQSILGRLIKIKNDFRGTDRWHSDLNNLIQELDAEVNGLACEHGWRDGEWCPDCNKAYKDAAKEHEREAAE